MWREVQVTGPPHSKVEAAATRTHCTPGCVVFMEDTITITKEMSRDEIHYFNFNSMFKCSRYGINVPLDVG